MFYFDFATWRRMLRLAWRETQSAPAHSAPRHAARPGPRDRQLPRDLLRARSAASSLRCAAPQIRTPVFIVGHARSGTTLLHRLMSRDADRFSAFLLYELFFPSLLQKKAIRFFARVRRAIARRRARAPHSRLGGAQVRQDARTSTRWGCSEPEEDDGVLTYSCASGAWIVRLPVSRRARLLPRRRAAPDASGGGSWASTGNACGGSSA